jgi:drug/metabolite transporter (DMT)-like permease
MIINQLNGVQSLIISGLFFTGVNLSVKYLTHLPTYQLVFFRSLFVATTMALVLKKLKLNPFAKFQKALIMRSLVGTCALILYYHTLQNMPLGAALVLHYTTPLFSLIISYFILKEFVSHKALPYYFLALIGVALVKNVDPNVALFDFILGIISAILSASSYAIIRKLNGKVNSLVIVFYFPFIAMLLTSPLAIGQWQALSRDDWPVIIGMGVCAVFAQIFLTRAYQIEQASNIVHFNYLGIIYGVIAAMIIFDEFPTPLTLIGAGIILFSIIKLFRLTKRDGH